MITGCKKNIKTKEITKKIIELPMEINKVNTQLSITFNKGIFIVIENKLDKPIIINRFVWSIPSLVLEIQDTNDNLIGMSPPPIPPVNLKDYEILIKEGENLEIPIGGINEIADKITDEGIKIRVKGFYKITEGKDKEVKVFSKWFFIDKTILVE